MENYPRNIMDFEKRFNSEEACVQHLNYYLDEFTFRFNRRTSKSHGMLFYRLVQQSLMIDPVHVKNLTS